MIAMSFFEPIEARLISFAKRMNATYSIDRPGMPVALRTFEERRIDWLDNNLNKAIIIQPAFELHGPDLSKWNFINIAWFVSAEIPDKIYWRKYIVERAPFEIIADNIDALLSASEADLSAITISYFKPYDTKKRL